MTAHRLRKPIPCVSPSTNFAVSSTSASHTTSSEAKIADSTWVKTRTKAGSDTARPRLGEDGSRGGDHGPGGGGPALGGRLHLGSTGLRAGGRPASASNN